MLKGCWRFFAGGCKVSCGDVVSFRAGDCKVSRSDIVGHRPMIVDSQYNIWYHGVIPKILESRHNISKYHSKIPSVASNWCTSNFQFRGTIPHSIMAGYHQSSASHLNFLWAIEFLQHYTFYKYFFFSTAYMGQFICQIHY